MPSAHCVSTVCGTILAVDQGFLNLMQRTEDELVGASYRSITDPRDLDKSARMLSSLVAKAAPVRIQKRYILPDGESVAANVLVTRFCDPDRLVSTLYWSDTNRELPPAKLWAAALHARHMNEVRRVQLGPEMYVDGSNRLLIEVYLAEAEGRSVSDCQLSNACHMAISTTQRWIKAFQKGGIISEYDPSRDVSFTQVGIKKIEKILCAMIHPSPEPSRLSRSDDMA